MTNMETKVTYQWICLDCLSQGEEYRGRSRTWLRGWVTTRSICKHRGRNHKGENGGIEVLVFKKDKEGKISCSHRSIQNVI